VLRGRAPNFRPGDRHRPGYFKTYRKRNLSKLRRYSAAKQRQYRRARVAA